MGANYLEQTMNGINSNAASCAVLLSQTIWFGQ